MRECCKCGDRKQLSDFPSGARKDGTHSWCRKCYNEYKRIHYAANREAQISRARAWNENNRERHRANVRRSNKSQSRKEYARKYVEEHKEKYRLHDNNKYHRRRAASGDGTVTPEEWIEILRASGGRCFYCMTESKRLVKDHFIPLSKGGQHIASNIVPACSLCNGQKHAMMPVDYMRRIGRA